MTSIFTTVKIFFASQERDSRYFKLLIGSGLIFILLSIQVANKFFFGSIERPIFHFFNNLPQALHWPMIVLTQFGNLVGLIFWVALTWRF